MVEKVVRTLQDLEDALALAGREGGCRIRVGERVALVMTDHLTDEEAERFVRHPSVAERLSKAARSIEEGRGIPHGEVVRLFGSGPV